jgi:pyrroloquinoline quinone (PQQ) biosynthesis protein C
MYVVSALRKEYPSIWVDLAEAMGVSMSKIWNKVKYYYLTHDGIEMFVFFCVFAFLGWASYHAIAGVIGRMIG